MAAIEVSAMVAAHGVLGVRPGEDGWAQGDLGFRV